VRNWIQGYAELAKPLAELRYRNAEFEWTKHRQDTFNKLKEQISSTPALRPVDYSSDNPIILSVDTSNTAVGFILAQLDEQGKRRPARYESLPIGKQESSYSQAMLELYGLYRALCHWRIHLVVAKKLQVEMDAKYVKGMLNSADPHPNAVMNRWIQGILMFNFELIHVPADKFVGPDALSRRKPIDDEHVADNDEWLENMALLMLVPDLENFRDFCFTTPTKLPYKPQELPSGRPGIRKQEDLLSEIYHFLSTYEKPVRDSVQTMKRFIKKATEFFLKDERMYKRNGTQVPLLVIFNSQKKIAILTQAHEKLGHRGEQAVYDLVRSRFHWPYLRPDVHHRVASCLECQI
jgi:hypothetical protein